MGFDSAAVLTIEELSAYLKAPKSTLYKLVREGNVPCRKVGRHWRFHRSAIDVWLKEHTGPRAPRKFKNSETAERKDSAIWPAGTQPSD